MKEQNEKPEISFFVPCLNEAPRIIGTLECIQKATSQANVEYEVLAFDDGSTDGTGEVIQKFAEENPQYPLTLYRNSRNIGVARTYVEAAFRSHGEFFRLIWGDNVEPPETIVNLLKRRHDADVVVPYYPNVSGKGFLRKGLSGVYTELINQISGFRLHYYNGSPLVKTRDVIRWAPRCYGFTGFMADFITHLLSEGASHVEIPVQGIHVAKDIKSTPVNPKNFFATGLTLLAILSRRLQQKVYRLRSSNRYEIKLTFDK